MRPKTQFADAGGVQIAYQTFGEGPDVVVVPGWVSNVEQSWESPEKAAFYADLAQTCRVTLFDKRGTGLSDRNVGAPTLEDRMDDLQAVMDAARIKRSIVFGISEGGSLAMVFAASNPERVRALALYGTFACREKKPDYPWAPSPEERQAFYDSISNAWSGEMDLAHSAPSLVGNQEHLERWARYLRSSATPSDALALAKLNTQIDVRHVLPLIRVPTVIMRRVGDRDVRREEAIYLQLHIPNAELRELPGEDHLPMVGDTAPILEIIREIAGAETPLSPHSRILSTVLFSDIVGSTNLVRQSGDEAWVQSMATHNDMVRKLVQQHRGTLVKFTGDGILAYFDGPSRAAQCALSLARQAPEIGLTVRAAVHTCEIELLEQDIVGIGVHLASRVMSVAEEGQVYATGTVKALVSGSNLVFEQKGEQTFKGFEEPVALFRVTELAPNLEPNPAER
jgi:class 3 adenylate cyclase